MCHVVFQNGHNRFREKAARLNEKCVGHAYTTAACTMTTVNTQSVARSPDSDYRARLPSAIGLEPFRLKYCRYKRLRFYLMTICFLSHLSLAKKTYFHTNLSWMKDHKVTKICCKIYTRNHNRFVINWNCIFKQLFIKNRQWKIA